MSISVVIRTRDEEPHFKQLLRSLAHQTLMPSELILINNYSTRKKERAFRNSLKDETTRAFGDAKVKVKLSVLADEEFSHAYSTNMGVDAAENELVCVTNAHSVPVSLRWLEEGAKHFKDRNIAGVSGFFVPHNEGTAIGKLDRKVYELTQKTLLRQDWCSTINCIIRKSLWRIYPFDEGLTVLIPETMKYGLEDYDWSKEMLARGYKIIIDSSFNVFHSHGRAVKEAVRNVKGYFVYHEIQRKINHLKRPRQSVSRVFETGADKPNVNLLN